MKKPPLLLIFSSLDEYNACLQASISEHEYELFQQLYEQGLPPVTSYTNLAVLFGFSENFIRSMAKNSERYYRTFSIPKGKKKREIQAPKVALKVIQKWVSAHLAVFLTYNDYVHGFVPHRSSLTAAQIHSNANWVYSLDIKNFFPSTPSTKIFESLLDIGYSAAGAQIITDLCCYKGFLAQGSPASPVLSNLVFQGVDTQIQEAISQIDPNIRYTRYADDLTFSGQNEFPEALKRIKEVIEQHGWEIADKKESLSISPQRLKVHGLVVHQDVPRLTKGYRNRIRAYKHLLKDGKIKKSDIAKVNGHLAYARLVDNLA